MSEETTPRRFSADDKCALAYVLDDIIPPSDDGRLPGAGEIGLADYLDESLANMPELKQMVIEGLAALQRLATRRHPNGLDALSKQDRAAVLNELAASADAIPPVLMLHTFTGYYQHARVVEALGLESRPPHPIGYTMQSNDLSLLDPVRRRDKMYRSC